jgi:hypothetical protein
MVVVTTVGGRSRAACDIGRSRAWPDVVHVRYRLSISVERRPNTSPAPVRQWSHSTIGHRHFSVSRFERGGPERSTDTAVRSTARTTAGSHPERGMRDSGPVRSVVTELQRGDARGARRAGPTRPVP